MGEPACEGGEAEANAEAAERIDLVAAERRLSEIEAALERLETGTYGRCASCGSPLSEEALAEDPLTLLCRPCASAGGASGRPS
jgi:RNA polymerase-binding transcription factor DksA